jgi:integrase
VSKRDDHAGTVSEVSRGNWRGSVMLDGRRVYRRGPTKAAVLAKLKVVRETHEAGLPSSGVPTVAQWLDHWLTHIAPKRVRPRTLESYSDLVRLHITPALGKHRLDKLRPEHIETAWVSVERAPATVLRCHRVLARALVVASHRGLIAVPPTSRMDAPTAPTKEQTPLSRQEARAVLAAAAEDRLAARWTVALSIGLRQGEALGLRWTDIDLTAGVLTVRRKLEKVRGVGFVLSPPKTKGSERAIRLPAQLVTALRDHAQQQRHERLAAGPLWHRGDFEGLVFTTETGQPIDRHNDRRAWLRLLRSAQVSAVRLHDGRHTAATLLLEQGVPARVVMQILGHSSTRLTLDVYSHVTRELADGAAEAMGRALWDDEKPNEATAP